MLQKTRGIVFRFTRFRETSIIVTIFTEHFGLQSYIVNGIRSASARGRIALYQPLTLLDLVVYHKEQGNIFRIKEIKCLRHYQSVATDIKKSAIAMFLTELLNRTVKHESHAAELFRYISSSLIKLDTSETGFENFHLIFMIGLSRLLGFGLHSATELIAGKATDKQLVDLLNRLLNSDFSDRVVLTHTQRRETLDLLLRFYKQHMDSTGDFKSVQVLREVLNGY